MSMYSMYIYISILTMMDVWKCMKPPQSVSWLPVTKTTHHETPLHLLHHSRHLDDIVERVKPR